MRISNLSEPLSTSFSSSYSDAPPSKTLYFSSFALFSPNEFYNFLKLVKLKIDLSNYLGSDWEKHAQVSLTCLGQNGSSVLVSSRVVYEVAFTVWIEMLSIMTSAPIASAFSYSGSMMQIEKEAPNQGQPIQNGFRPYQPAFKEAPQRLQRPPLEMIRGLSDFQNQLAYEFFEARFSSFFPSHFKNMATYSSVINAFYVSALLLWTSTISLWNPQNEKNFQTAAEQFNPKRSRVIKPMMVTMVSCEGVSQSSRKESLTSEISMESEGGAQREHMKIKKMSKKSEKLVDPANLEQILDMIDQSAQTSVDFAQGKWQITKDLVTNIVEVNYTSFVAMSTKRFEKKQKLIVKLCIMKPVKGFYSKMLEIFLMHQISTFDIDLTLDAFIEKVKENLGRAWADSLKVPTTFFWTVAHDEWNQIKLIKNDFYEVNH